MSMETLNTYCVSSILSHVKYSVVLKFARVYPGQFEAVKAYFMRLRVLDVDEFLDNELPDIDLSLSKNLQTLKLTKKRYLECFEDLPTAIRTHCQHIEVLNIPAIPLMNEDVETLSSLTTLRSLSINCRGVKDEVLGQLFQSNAGLEEVCIFDFKQTLTGVCFEKLPNSFKSLKMILSRVININFLLKRMENCQLESLCLQTRLQPEHMRILSQHTTFKSLHIEIVGDDSMLQTLLQNNPQLVTLHVKLCDGRACSRFFRYLPLTLKDLKLDGYFIFSDNIFFDRLRSLDLESLRINCRTLPGLMQPEYNSNFLKSLVELVPNLQTLGLPVADQVSLQPLGQLKKLKCFRLEIIYEEINNFLNKISENCPNLEDLDLYGATFLSKEGVEQLVKLPKLKKLSIFSAFDSFNTDSMIILSGCKTLETVRIIARHQIDKNASLPLLLNDTLRFIEFGYFWKHYSNNDFTRLIERIVDIVDQQTERKEILTVTLPFDVQRKKEILEIPRLPPLLHFRDFIDNDLFLIEAHSLIDI